MTKTQQDIDTIISENWLKLTNSEIGKLCGKNYDYICNRGKSLGLPNKHNKTGLHLKKELPKIELTQAPEEIHEKVKKHLKNGNHLGIDELSDLLDVGVSKVKSALLILKENGYNITEDNGKVLLSNTIQKSEPTVLSVKKMSTGLYKFGACGDNHLCSKYERLDVLNALYDYYEQQGITTVYNTGNWIDGEARFNKTDIHTHGLANQVDYFIEKYPKRKGITTYFVSGDDHEGWYVQNQGIDIGEYAQMKAKKSGRNDLVYIGHMEADVVLPAKKGQTVIRVQHPGGGSAYAISYTSQKIVESFTGAEKPDVLLIGHYHKAEYLFVRGVHVIQTATTMAQSPFMRKKRLAAHLGGWVIEMGTDDNGAVTKFKTEYLPFYDTEYYKKWAYEWG